MEKVGYDGMINLRIIQLYLQIHTHFEIIRLMYILFYFLLKLELVDSANELLIYSRIALRGRRSKKGLEVFCS